MKTSPRLPSYARLLTLIDAGKDHRHWYQEAHPQIVAGAAVLGITVERFAALLALFSPRTSVIRSVRHTVRYVREKTYNHAVIASVRASVEHYEKTGEIRGPKTGPFYRALLGDADAVVVDTWIALAFNADPRDVRSKYVLEPIARRIRALAKHLGWTPREVQAAIWAGIVRENRVTVPTLFILPEVDGIPF